jgi:hypothetical protein
MQVQILNQISQVSDNLEPKVLGNVVDTVCVIDHDFTETHDIEGALTDIMVT